jgi:uncharacterized protein (TIGR02145 family)
MKYRHLLFFPALISILAIASCSDSAPSDIGTNTNAPDIQAETLDDLPNCSKNREGEIAEVTQEKKAYICEDGRWEFDHVILDSVKTEDDLSACLSKNEGDSVWVEKESAIYVCTDRRWEKQETKDNENTGNDSIPTYESEDDLPNCTSSRSGNVALINDTAMLCNEDIWQKIGTAYETSDSVPNCTEKRDGETAFILDEYQALVCSDGKWSENEEVEDVVVKPEEKSSSSGKATSSSSSAKATSSSSAGDEDPESSSANEEVVTDTFTDPRDEKTYKTVKIGNRVWFAENLNYDDGKSLCPMEDPENCEKYGRLYKFESDDFDSKRSNVCPAGWRIPDSLDFAELIAYVSKHNGGEPVGVSLKAKKGWISAGDTVTIEGDGTAYGSLDSTRVGATKGTDRFGFAALPAGSCWSGGGCYVGDDTRFYAIAFGMENQGGSYKLAFDKDDFLYDQDGMYGWISVRCVKYQPLDIDSMPPTAVVETQDFTLEGMLEDLSYMGSTKFTPHEAQEACPAGWRLPTQNEFLQFLNEIDDADAIKNYPSYYFLDFGIGLAERIRCVKEN